MHRDNTRLIVLVATAFCISAHAQQTASELHLQSPQDPRTPALLETCSNPPPPAAPRRSGSPASIAALPAAPISTAIPGVIASGQTWTLRWSTPGNNADGIIAAPGGGVIVAGNDSGNVVRIDSDDSISILYTDTNTGGAVSRSKTGRLFLAERGFNPAITLLEPDRHVHASRFNGEPLDCIGGVMNDLAADSKGGVYFTYGGLFYANVDGVITEYGQDLQTNGIVLSPNEQTLYVTNGRTLAAFDVNSDGSLSNQREFAQLRGPRGDGSTVDAAGRLYVSTGAAVDVFSASGEYLGTIPGPDGLHGVAFSGPDKRTLYAIIYIGAGPNGPESQVVSIPALAQGYTGRAK